MRPGRPLALSSRWRWWRRRRRALLAAPGPLAGRRRLLNVLATGAKKLNIVIPNFAVVGGPDTASLGRGSPR